MSKIDLSINPYPNECCLRGKSNIVDRISDSEKEILEAMAEKMYEVGGIGLAAPQVGIERQLIVIDAGSGLLKFANPKIIARQGHSFLEEGCLSIPGVSVNIKRSDKITVKFLDTDNTYKEISAEGLLSRAFQHEIDHLNGKLIIDYLPLTKRLFRLRKGRI